MPRVCKSITDVRAEARKHTGTAIRVLTGIASNDEAPPAARVTAAQALLDRGWGKATQPISGDAENPLKIEIIERVIIDKAEDRDR